MEACGTQLALGTATCSSGQCPHLDSWGTRVGDPGQEAESSSMARGQLLPEAGPSLPPGPPRRLSTRASGPSTAAAAGQGQARSPHLAHSGQRLCQPEGKLPALAGLGHDSPSPCRHGVRPSDAGDGTPDSASQEGTKPGGSPHPGRSSLANANTWDMVGGTVRSPRLQVKCGSRGQSTGGGVLGAAASILASSLSPVLTRCQEHRKGLTNARLLRSDCRGQLCPGHELPAILLQSALPWRNLSCSDDLGLNPVLCPHGLCDLG